MTIRLGSAPERSARRRRLARRRRSPANRSRARATIDSSAGSAGAVEWLSRPPRGAALAPGTELLRRVAEVLDLRARPLSSVELLALAIHPDHGHVHLLQRRDVGVKAGGNVDPALLAADPPRRLLEVRRVGLVAAHLLSRDHELELGAQVAARDAEQLVVDVGDDPDLVALAEPVHRRIGLAEGKPAG